MEELEAEKKAHSETKQKLGLLEKEAKSSTLMNMELEDYQRSILALEGKLASKDQQLGEAKQESKVKEESIQQLRRDGGLLL